MAAVKFHPYQRIKVDGRKAVILDVLDAQLFVEFDLGVQSFILFSGGHSIEIETSP